MDLTRLEQMVEQGHDSYEARLALGQAYWRTNDYARAIEHLTHACDLAPDKTMAWQVLGQAHEALGQVDEARAAWSQGLFLAQSNGDQQAEKVMRVFLKRLT